MVAVWAAGHRLESLFFSAVGEAELRYGAAIMPTGQRRETLVSDIERMLGEAFEDRVLPFDSGAARAYADIAARRRSTGRPVAPADCQIAAIRPLPPHGGRDAQCSGLRGHRHRGRRSLGGDMIVTRDAPRLVVPVRNRLRATRLRSLPWAGCSERHIQTFIDHANSPCNVAFGVTPAGGFEPTSAPTGNCASSGSRPERRSTPCAAGAMDTRVALDLTKRAAGTLAADIEPVLRQIADRPRLVAERRQQLEWWAERLGHLRRHAITPSDVRAALAELRQTHAASTCNHYRQALFSLYKTLDGRDAPNPLRGRRTVPEPRPAGARALVRRDPQHPGVHVGSRQRDGQGAPARRRVRGEGTVPRARIHGDAAQRTDALPSRAPGSEDPDARRVHRQGAGDADHTAEHARRRGARGSGVARPIRPLLDLGRPARVRPARPSGSGSTACDPTISGTASARRSTAPPATRGSSRTCWGHSDSRMTERYTLGHVPEAMRAGTAVFESQLGGPRNAADRG